MVQMKTSKQSALLITQSKNIIDTIRSLLEVKTDITIVQSSLEAKNNYVLALLPTVLSV